MRGRTGAEFLGLAVRTRGIELGKAVDLIIDAERARAVGLDVLCGDETHRFLPLACARIDGDHIDVPSPLVLLDFGHVGFYRREGRALSAVRGSTVDGNGGATIADVVVEPDGSIAELVIEDGAGTRTVPLNGTKLATAEADNRQR